MVRLRHLFVTLVGLCTVICLSLAIPNEPSALTKAGSLPPAVPDTKGIVSSVKPIIKKDKDAKYTKDKDAKDKDAKDKDAKDKDAKDKAKDKDTKAKDTKGKDTNDKGNEGEANTGGKNIQGRNTSVRRSNRTTRENDSIDQRRRLVPRNYDSFRNWSSHDRHHGKTRQVHRHPHKHHKEQKHGDHVHDQTYKHTPIHSD